MSARKAAHDRRMMVLNRARESGRIALNCEGGMARSNRDIQRLVRDGYLKIYRPGGIPKWSKRFNELVGRGYFHSSDMIRRTYAFLTPKGAALLGLGWVVER